MALTRPESIARFFEMSSIQRSAFGWETPFEIGRAFGPPHDLWGEAEVPAINPRRETFGRVDSRRPDKGTSVSNTPLAHCSAPTSAGSDGRHFDCSKNFAIGSK